MKLIKFLRRLECHLVSNFSILRHKTAMSIKYHCLVATVVIEIPAPSGTVNWPDYL